MTELCERVLDGSRTELDERVGAVTLADLVTMRAGHQWDVVADYDAWWRSGDQLRYAVRKPATAPRTSCPRC